jgi:hypothetical protein
MSRQTFWLTMAICLVVPFQNCSHPVQYQGRHTEPQNSPGGVDGKTFVSYGQCEGGVAVTNALLVGKANGAAAFVRRDCKDLASPEEINAKSLQFLFQTDSTFVLQNKVYDRLIGGASQITTIETCQDSAATPSLQVALWKVAGDNGQLFAQVTRIDKVNTGTVAIQAPSASAPNTYLSNSGQPGKIELALNADGTANLKYSINSGALVTAAGLTCASQQLPATATAYADGTGGAPQGLPSHPDELKLYPTRPNWKVAGIDYAVGIPMGTVLKDPTLVTINGVSVDIANRLIRVTGDNVTLDGFDFSLHGGYQVYIDGQFTTIKNSFIGLGRGIQAGAGSSNLTVSNCVLEGTGFGSLNGGLIYQQGTGALVLRYNWFRNFPGVAVHQTGNGGLDMQFNLFENGGTQSGSSPYYLTFGQNTLSRVVVKFNTSVQAAAASTVSGFDLSYVSKIVTAEVAHNTLIARMQNSMTYLIRAGVPGASDAVSASIHDNFLDATGATGPFYQGVSTPAITYLSNIDLASGSPLPNGP